MTVNSPIILVFLGVTVDSLKLWLLGLQLVFSESWMRIDSWANI